MTFPRFSLRPTWRCGLRFLTLALLAPWALAQIGSVQGYQKISDTQGGFTGDLEPGGRFGLTVAAIGDLDGDGIGDLVVGKEADDDGGVNRGAVFVLFLAGDGSVRQETKISSTAGGFGGLLQDQDRFGAALASLGDLDGDGTLELAVGEIFDDGLGAPGARRGALWILSLRSDGTVAAQHKLTEGQAGFSGPLGDDDWFGVSLAHLGDPDGAGPARAALAVGALRDDDGGPDRGALWILLLDSAGQVLAQTKLSALAGGFGGALEDGDRFGRKLCAIGDLDGDGVTDLVASAPGDEGAGTDRGALWVLWLNGDGTAKAWRELGDGQGGFTGALDDGDLFGRGLGTPGDLDCDGIVDLVVGAIGDDDGGPSRGAVWLLFLRPDGSVREGSKISATSGGFGGALDDLDVFGTAAVGVADVDGDGVGDIAVGAPGDDDGGTNHGALWLLFLEREGQGLGTTYCCPAVTNSTGAWAQLTATGSDVAAQNDLTLTTEDLPPERFGFYIVSREIGWLPAAGGSAGVLCLGGQIARLADQAGSSGPEGRLRVSVDLTSIPQLGPVSAGETWYFQLWYRDVVDSLPGSNFSDAVSIPFQ